jgi:hypothetical protein
MVGKKAGLRKESVTSVYHTTDLLAGSRSGPLWFHIQTYYGVELPGYPRTIQIYVFRLVLGNLQC